LGGASEPSDDFSTAILSSSNSKNTLRVVGGDDSVGHNVVGLAEEAMEKLEVFEGDVVHLKGKRGKSTVATVAAVDQSEVDGTAVGSDSVLAGLPAISMSVDAMKNAGVRAGDAITVTSHDAKFGKAVLILPFQDSMPADEDVEVDIIGDYLAPYFQGKFRALSRGDSFTLDGPAGKIEFSIVEIDSVEADADSSCVVVDDTVIEFEGEVRGRGGGGGRTKQRVRNARNAGNARLSSSKPTTPRSLVFSHLAPPFLAPPHHSPLSVMSMIWKTLATIRLAALRST